MNEVRSATHEPYAAAIERIVRACLFRENENQQNAVAAEGVVARFSFHPARLQAHRDEVRALLDAMPKAFHHVSYGGGGGGFFLELNHDKNSVEWTSFHRPMDELICLGIACGLASYCMPREDWSSLPLGMPYIVFDTRPELQH